MSDAKPEQFQITREHVLSLALAEERVKSATLAASLAGRERDSVRDALNTVYGKDGTYRVMSIDVSTGIGVRHPVVLKVAEDTSTKDTVPPT